MPNHSPGWLKFVLFVGLVVLIVVAFSAADLLLKPPSQPVATTGRTRGSPDAKVTLVEYSDFQ